MGLTQQQSNCLKTVIDLYKQRKKIITISGPAGAGKSFIINTLIDELNLWDNVAFATFTGKAALVLRERGMPATTIHKLIYEAKYNPKTQSFYFKKKEYLDDNIELIVIDEISMVSKALLLDLQSFNIPIIALGDDAQLAPIGEDNGLLINPDFRLTEVIRQAADNPIIYFSKLIREGKIERMNNDKVKVIYPRKFTYDMAPWADQILCGFNNTRKQLNTTIRKEFFKTDSKMPLEGEKLISLQNKWNITDTFDEPLINGSQLILKRDKGLRYGGATLKGDFIDIGTRSKFLDLPVATAPFLKTEAPVNPTDKRAILDFGYVITYWKSQGSEWNKVLVFAENVLRTEEDFRRSLYTAVTRARDQVIVVLK